MSPHSTGTCAHIWLTKIFWIDGYWFLIYSSLCRQSAQPSRYRKIQLSRFPPKSVQFNSGFLNGVTIETSERRILRKNYLIKDCPLDCCYHQLYPAPISFFLTMAQNSASHNPSMFLHLSCVTIGILNFLQLVFLLVTWRSLHLPLTRIRRPRSLRL